MKADASAAVRDVWSKFFNSSTPAEQRMALLQDGEAFHDALADESSTQISATVSKVTFSDDAHAAVSFTLRLGSTRLPSVAGAAVQVHGKWLVSKSTMCVVLAASGQRSQACS